MFIVPEDLKAVLEKPVAILGYGVSGRGVERLLKASDVSYAIFDAKEEGCEKDFTQSLARGFGLVVHSPGISKQHPWRLCAQEAGCWVLAELDFAAVFWQGSLIAITGTNGKSTVTTFLAQAIQALGKQATAAGNIGYTFSDLVVDQQGGQKAIAVCEVSSFQAQDLEYFKPEAVLWTNFAEDHLDYHADLKEYFLAKLKLVKNLGAPIIFVGETVELAAKKLRISLPTYATIISPSQYACPEGVFSRPPQSDNYALIASYWISQGWDLSVLEKAASSFKSLAHRLNKVAEIDGITFWNDSKATNFDAVYGALRYFDQKVVWIGGGKDKGCDLEYFVSSIYHKIERAYLIGETGQRLQALLTREGIIAVYCLSLDEAISKAKDDSAKNSNVLFAPGFSSYDMFKNYEDRGNRFERDVLGLKNKIKCAF